MSIQFNKLNNVFQSKQWLLDGWKMFKKKPLTWLIMLLIFNIFFIVGSSHFISRYIVALLLPTLTAGIYLAAHKSSQGEPISIEDLFSMFKNPEKLKQLLLMGAIGMVVMLLSSFFGFLVTLPWLFALLFGVPLVAIKNELAITALQHSLMASFSNLAPILLFYLFTMILTVVAVIPVGLGLLVLGPVIFGASYSAFKMVFLDGELYSQEKDQAQVESKVISAQPIAAKVTDDKIEPSFSEKLVSQTLNSIAGKTDTSGEVELPSGFEIDYYDDYMHIIRTWLNPISIISIVLTALMFNGVWIINDFPDVLMNHKELLLRLFALTFIVIGLTLLYFVIATWLNKTHIYVSKNAIEVKHKPVPWLGNKRIQTSNIKQFFVEEKGRTKEVTAQQRRVIYNVIGLTNDDERFSLIKGLRRSHHAIYIEQRIEKYLRIKDVVNPEEYGYDSIKKDKTSDS